MELNVFLKYPSRASRGVIGVLSSFGHDQYPFKNNVDV
jgi:hypothetical protein